MATTASMREHVLAEKSLELRTVQAPLETVRGKDHAYLTLNTLCFQLRPWHREQTLLLPTVS